MLTGGARLAPERPSLRTGCPAISLAGRIAEMPMYVPEWETLTDALKRVVGLDLDEAKIQLCSAISDGKVATRVEIDRAESDMKGRLLCGLRVSPPARLKPVDLDWDKSKPLHPWLTGTSRPEMLRLYGHSVAPASHKDVGACYRRY
jgi:hypothetical protein